MTDQLTAAVTRLDTGLRLLGGIGPDDADNDAVRVVLNALAARTREVEAMRADLRLIANAYDDGTPTGGLAARCYDMACVARRALAAQEGTNG